jgi:hypothetical protein
LLHLAGLAFIYQSNTHGHSNIKSDIMCFKKVVIPPMFHKILHYRLIEGCVVNRLHQS